MSLYCGKGYLDVSTVYNILLFIYEQVVPLELGFPRFLKLCAILCLKVFLSAPVHILGVACRNPEAIHLPWKMLQQRYKSISKKISYHTNTKYQKYVKFRDWYRILFHLRKYPFIHHSSTPKEPFCWYNLCLYKNSFLEWWRYADKSPQDNFLTNPADTSSNTHRLSCYQAGMQGKITLEELRIRGRCDINIAFCNKADYSPRKCHSQVTNLEGRETVSETVWRVCQKARCCYWKTTSHKLALVPYRAGTQQWYLLCWATVCLEHVILLAFSITNKWVILFWFHLLNSP